MAAASEAAEATDSQAMAVGAGDSPCAGGSEGSEGSEGADAAVASGASTSSGAGDAAERGAAGSTGEDAEAPEAAELTAPKIGESRTPGLCGEAGSGLLGRGWTTP